MCVYTHIVLYVFARVYVSVCVFQDYHKEINPQPPWQKVQFITGGENDNCNNSMLCGLNLEGKR